VRGLVSLLDFRLDTFDDRPGERTVPPEVKTSSVAAIGGDDDDDDEGGASWVVPGQRPPSRQYRAQSPTHAVVLKTAPGHCTHPAAVGSPTKFILHMVLCLRMGHIGVGWGSAVDPKTGQTYWFNKETRKVQWEAGEQISRLALTKHLTEFVLVFVLVFVRFSSWHARLSGHAGLYSVTVRRIDSFEIDDEKPSMLRGAWRG
jgi:hypothetical protein